MTYQQTFLLASPTAIPTFNGFIWGVGLAVAIVLLVFMIYKPLPFFPSSKKDEEIITDQDLQTFENIFNGSNLKDPMLQAFKQVEDILVHHSGPFASNAIIGSRYRQVNDIDEFTKDGINILKHVLVTEDVSSRVAVRLARYVGIAVDARCHDGTTTSMLMFCALAKIAIEKMDQDYIEAERYDWTERLKVALNRCLELIGDLRITEDDILACCNTFDIETTPEDIRSAMAYHMAMISSKGDHGLSTKIAHIIRSSPKKIYGMYRNIPLAIETEEPYILKRQEYDLAARANLGHMDHFNYRNNTQYVAKDAVIFATANVISLQSMEAGFLQAFISVNPRSRADLATFGVEGGWETLHEGKRNLIILTPQIDDPNLIETINNFNYNNPSIKISWFHFQVDHKLRTSFNKTLHYMAGVPLFEDVLFSDAASSLIGLGDNKPDVKLVGSFLTISNLFKRDESAFHPFYRDPEAFVPYTEFARETEEIIQFAQDNITNASLDQNELTMLTSFYRSLTCQEIYDIEVGGSKHDQLANQTVYEDAIGAALSAVDEGVILGGYMQLAAHFDTLSIDSEIGQYFAEAFRKIVTDSLRITSDEQAADLFDDVEVDKWSYLFADRAFYKPNSDASDYIRRLSLDKDGLIEFLKQTPNYPVLLQAYGGYHEQFKRFRDILPKLSNSSHLIDMRSAHDVGNV